MFEIKYFINGVELKTGMMVKCLCCGSYGDVEDIFPIVIKNNKLYIQTVKKELREVYGCLIDPLEIVE
jgi:hypothetical protein